jgi:hypothetical protein
MVDGEVLSTNYPEAIIFLLPVVAFGEQRIVVVGSKYFLELRGFCIASKRGQLIRPFKMLVVKILTRGAQLIPPILGSYSFDSQDHHFPFVTASRMIWMK